MTSAEKEQKKICIQLKHLTLKRQQLLERKKILRIFQELRKRAEFGETGEADTQQSEIDSINDTLEELTEKKIELQKSLDSFLKDKGDKGQGKSEKEQSSAPCKVVSGLQESNIFYVDAPPPIPAPKVILDLESLPSHPCKTQCPECRQFITTETFTTVSSMTWLACFMTAILGCVAGCCLVPFCLDRFKSTTHRCPKCRSFIQTIKRL